MSVPEATAMARDLPHMLKAAKELRQIGHDEARTGAYQEAYENYRDALAILHSAMDIAEEIQKILKTDARLWEKTKNDMKRKAREAN